MLTYYNPHPQGKKTRDCVKRALTRLLEIDYREVSLRLNRLKKETGSQKYNASKNWKTFVAQLGWKQMSFPAVAGKNRMNGYSFCQTYPKGKYLLRMAKHLVACVDGVIYDTWDCQDKCVYVAWKVQ